ncbi:MAG: dTMP kinase [Candidatus Eremiobacteraeota bacterium]|nr:dTMP kinase [Candidatus Eremiobacteraeota bacterium]
MFITFEGIEGSGKTTLMHAVVGALRKQRRAVVKTHEPGGTPVGDRIRAIFLDRALTISPLAEALLLNASRAHLVAEVIEPALQRGQIVLCDRFIDSTLAYQGYGRGLDLSMLHNLSDTAARGRLPDVTFFVDISVALSRERVASRERADGQAQDRLDREDDAFHERVRGGYLELARSNQERIHVLDGTMPQAQLAASAVEALQAYEKIPTR